MLPLTQTSSPIDFALSQYDLRREILSHVPPKNLSERQRHYECSSCLKASACVSKAWNKDAKIIKQQWVEKNFVSLKTYGGLKTVADVIEYIVINKITRVNLYEFKNRVFSDPSAIKLLFEKCNGLQSLSLECNGITDKGLTSISKECSTLQVLNLERNVISDVGLTHIIQKCPNLLSLFLGNTHHVTAAGLPSILENCPNLQVLSLESFFNATDDELANILEKCVNLQSLKLAFTSITDAGLDSIFKNCHDLTSLDLTSLKQITDAGLASIFKNLPKLQSLNLNFTKVSDEGFASMQENSPLQSLELWETQITDAGIVSVLEKCPGLQTLDLLYKPDNTTARGLASIKEKYPNLQMVLENDWAARVNQMIRPPASIETSVVMIGPPASIEVSVECNTGYGNSLVLCGDGGGLSWNPSQGKPLNCHGEKKWTISIPSDVKEFKLVLKTIDGAFKWELDGNHTFNSVQFPLKPKFPNKK
ncbi:MAG: carbohydrate-binding module family 20 domain-containing protein [Rhabdochlamydiaceae bacterium]